jgi:hypothetical protein
MLASVVSLCSACVSPFRFHEPGKPENSMIQWVRSNTLTTIALFAFLALSAMLVEQARIINSQQTLIRLLYSDSQELNARKVHDLQAKRLK